jgi:CubicO group peptidase (beta-lactamase class C family)
MIASYRDVLLVLSMFYAFTGGAQPSTLQPSLDTAAIDRFVAQQMVAQHLPGLALTITHGDQVLYVKGYGTARDGQPVTPQTQFMIASLSKSFTAVAVMQLVEQGKIDLDAPVRTYLTEFALADANAAARITVRQLLNHTSGLADRGFPHMRLPQPATPAERVASMRAARPLAAPGTEFHYFDPNYQVLARVVERVSNQPLSDYLQAHVFAPLQMAQSFNANTAPEAQQRASSLAQGHVLAFGIPIPAAELPYYFGGSGGVNSTAEDLAHYLIMQHTGGRFRGTTLLSPESVALMHTPPPNVASSYAMGWIATTQDSTRVLEHNGILSTFYAEAVLLPDNGYGIALLSNSHALTADIAAFPQLRRGLIALLLGRQPSTGRWSIEILRLITGGITLLGVALALRSLLNLPRWPGKAGTTPPWRLVLGIGWAFTPGIVVLSLPWLVAMSSDRVFDQASLFRSMPELFVWLASCGALGALNGIARIVMLGRRGLLGFSRRDGG